MYCNYDDNLMELEFIDVVHRYDDKEKNYYNIPRYKCSCGCARVPLSVYEFLDKNIDNDLQYSMAEE